jgi:hypothetical protein
VVENAYGDIMDLKYTVFLGGFLRNLHRWAGHGIVIAVPFLDNDPQGAGRYAFSGRRAAIVPQWKGYQRAYYREEAAKLRQALVGVDQAQRENIDKRLRYVSRPDFRIHQILLDGGRRADRCITCHLDLEKLEKAHSQIQQFPFEQYGCTECHGGVGRATEKSRAHSTLRIPHRPLYEYLQAHGSKTARIDLFNCCICARGL